MSRRPRMTGADVLSALSRAGVMIMRIRGSHHFVRHDDGRRTVVPVHSGEIIGPGLLQKILRDCGMSMDESGNLVPDK